MQRYILTRLIQAIIAVLLISLIVFMLARITGDPIALMAPPDATVEDMARIRKSLGLEQPLHMQYLTFVTNAIRGDFGQSIRFRKDTLTLYLSRLPNTLQLAGVALVMSMATGLTVGILSGVNPGGWVDRFGKVFALLGQSMPTFWVGIMLIWFLSVTFRLLPTSGMGGWQNILMPAFTLGWFSMAAVTRISRSAMLEVMDADYVRMLRVKGLPARLIMWQHGLKNACIPILTLGSIQLIHFLSGSVVVEQIFAWPGIGRLAVEAVFNRDFPVVQTVVLITSTLFVLTNLAVDILYAYVDPRIRY